MKQHVRKSERQKYFLMLIITCVILVFLLSSLCSSFIFFSSSNYQIKTWRSTTLDVGTQLGPKPLSRGKPSQTLPLIQLRWTKTLDLTRRPSSSTKSAFRYDSTNFSSLFLSSSYNATTTQSFDPQHPEFWPYYTNP